MPVRDASVAMDAPMQPGKPVAGSRPDDLPPLARLPLLILAFAGLFVAVGAGLARMGWNVPGGVAAAAALHGPLMLCGFFGVVIALERAVAIGHYWAYLAPLLTGLGSVAAIAGEVSVSAPLFVAGSLVLVAASIDILRRQRALFTLTMALASACWAVGSVLWAAGSSMGQVVWWWLSFPVLTIAGERLELSRFLRPSPLAKLAFAAILGVTFVGLANVSLAWGLETFGAGLLSLAAWLASKDLARRTVRSRGLTRFIAACLLSGYAWLAIGGAIILGAASLSPGARSYDAALHALGLGFVFSMVFGHAPIIFPAVLRIRIAYHPTFYAPLALLHASLVVRLIGDAAMQASWMRWGGLANALALAAFVVSTLSAAVRGRRQGSVA